MVASGHFFGMAIGKVNEIKMLKSMCNDKNQCNNEPNSFLEQYVTVVLKYNAFNQSGLLSCPVSTYP